MKIASEVKAKQRFTQNKPDCLRQHAQDKSQGAKV